MNEIYLRPTLAALQELDELPVVAGPDEPSWSSALVRELLREEPAAQARILLDTHNYQIPRAEMKSQSFTELRTFYFVLRRIGG